MAMTSRTFKAKNSVEYAGRSTMAVSAPSSVPPRAMTSSASEMRPASAAITATSTATFMPWLKV